MERKSGRARNAFVAALLSICPGLGQQYAGFLVRGIFCYVFVILVFWGSAIAFMYIKSRVLGLGILFLPFFIVFATMIDAAVCASRQPYHYELKWFNRAWIYIVVFAGLLVTVNPLMDVLIGNHIVRAYFVETRSMYPAIIQHDLVVINKLLKPKRGAIALIGYRDKSNTGSISEAVDAETLRRIVGVPGDEVEIQGRKVFVNNRELDEPYVTPAKTSSHNELNDENYMWGPAKVPKDSYFVLSDAREYIFDSRVIGFVEKERIIGITEKIFWSWNFDTGSVRWNRTALSID